MGQSVTALSGLFDIGGTIIGGLTSAVGQGLQGFTASQNSAYQAQVAQNNAKIAFNNAKAIERQGQAAIQERQLQQSQTIGAQRAGFAARGIVVDQDTAAILARDESRLSVIDQLTILDNAKREAWGARMQGQNFLTEAKFRKKESKAIKTGTAIGIAGTLLTTATSAATKWYQYKSNQETYGGGTTVSYGASGGR